MPCFFTRAKANALQFLLHVKIVMGWVGGGVRVYWDFYLFCLPREDTSLYAVIASDVKYNEPVQANLLKILGEI